MANLKKELRKAQRNHKYEVSEAGFIFPKQKLSIGGGFLHNVNGKDERYDANRVVNEGLDYILDVAFKSAADLAPYYITCWKNDVTDVATWTAASWATDVAGSGVDVTETTRPAWIGGTVASQQVDNYASKAQLTIDTATITLYGAAMLTDSAFGGTAGKLLIAKRFSAQRDLQQDDAFNIGYRITIAST